MLVHVWRSTFAYTFFFFSFIYFFPSFFLFIFFVVVIAILRAKKSIEKYVFILFQICFASSMAPLKRSGVLLWYLRIYPSFWSGEQNKKKFENQFSVHIWNKSCVEMVRAQAGDNRRMVRERFPSNGVPNFELFLSVIRFTFFFRCCWNWDGTFTYSPHIRCVWIYYFKTR